MSRNKKLSLKRKLSVSAYNQSGIALPLVLMVLIVLTILGTAAWTASQSSLAQATRLEPAKRAEYLARSAVDATKEAWIVAWLNNSATVPTSADFYTRYDESSDQFVNVPSADIGSHPDIIHTTLAYNTSTGICTVEATATVAGISRQIRAVSEELNETSNAELDPPWYIVERESFLWWEWNEYYIKGDPDNTVTDSSSGLTTAYHFVDSIVNVSLPEDEPLYLNRDFDRRVGYQAKKILFNCEVDLYSNNTLTSYQNPCYLVVSAETIDFNRSLTISDGASGALLLHLPEGSGISGEVVYHNLRNNSDKTKVDQDAYYGLVSFSNVDIQGSLFENPREDLIANRTFYFRHSNDADVLPIGIEPTTISSIADWLGITDPNADFRCQSLISNGYLIEAPANIKADYQVLFVYD